MGCDNLRAALFEPIPVLWISEKEKTEDLGTIKSIYLGFVLHFQPESAL